MITLFVDAYYYLALLNPRDAAHNRVMAASRQLHGRHLTTTWVLSEVADALAAPAQRGAFVALLQQVRGNARVTVLPPSQGLFDRAADLYASRPDKEWSLTDCVSFVVMRDRGIRDALTSDHHFEQAGFRALLRHPLSSERT